MVDYLKRQKLLEDLITDNNVENLKQNVEFLTSIIAISSSAGSLIAELLDSINSGKIISVESLLDAIIILYNECSTSSLRREKTVSDFVETSKIFFYNILIEDVLNSFYFSANSNSYFKTTPIKL